jgi:hypothetical protein
MPAGTVIAAGSIVIESLRVTSIWLDGLEVGVAVGAGDAVGGAWVTTAVGDGVAVGMGVAVGGTTALPAQPPTTVTRATEIRT